MTLVLLAVAALADSVVFAALLLIAWWRLRALEQWATRHAKACQAVADAVSDLHEIAVEQAPRPWPARPDRRER